VDGETEAVGIAFMFLARFLSSEAWRRETDRFWSLLAFSLTSDHGVSKVGLGSFCGEVF